MIALEVVQTYAFPPIVPLAMMALQLGKGLIDNSAAKKQQAKADSLAGAIPRVDPGVQNHLNDLRMRTRYAETGMSKIAAYKKQTAENAGAQTATNLLRGAGTSPGALQQGLLRNEDRTQDALMRGGAESEAQAGQYFAMQTPLISDIADRGLSLDTYARDKASFTAAQTQQNANNALTGVMGLGSMLDPKLSGKSTPASPWAGLFGTPDAAAGDVNFNPTWFDPSKLGVNYSGIFSQ